MSTEPVTRCPAHAELAAPAPFCDDCRFISGAKQVAVERQPGEFRCSRCGCYDRPAAVFCVECAAGNESRLHIECVRAPEGYDWLLNVLDEALRQAARGKGRERHAGKGEAFEDQQIVQLGEWMGSTAFAVGQACKKALESTRLGPEAARAELLGAINYLAAAVIQIDREEGRRAG